MNKFDLKLGQSVVWLDPEGLTSDIYAVDSIDRDDYISLSNEFSAVDAYEEELYDLRDVVACKHCGNIDIVKPLWIYANSGMSSNYEESEQYYCNKCEKVILGEPVELLKFQK